MRATMSPAFDHSLPACDACLHLEPNSVPKISTPVTVYPTTQSGCGSPRKFRMVARFYETNYGHYILLNQDRTYGANAMYLNLKHTSVQRVDTSQNLLRFVSNSCDGMSLTMGLASEEALQKWMSALEGNQKSGLSGSKSPAIPRSPLLPTLTEDEEE